MKLLWLHVQILREINALCYWAKKAQKNMEVRVIEQSFQKQGLSGKADLIKLKQMGFDLGVMEICINTILVNNSSQF